jgi:hypothetical protein
MIMAVALPCNAQARITVRVSGAEVFSANSVRTAKWQAGQIMLAAGVAVTWLDCGALRTEPRMLAPSLTNLWIGFVAEPARAADVWTLGYAMPRNFSACAVYPERKATADHFGVNEANSWERYWRMRSAMSSAWNTTRPIALWRNILAVLNTVWPRKVTCILRTTKLGKCANTFWPVAGNALRVDIKGRRRLVFPDRALRPCGKVRCRFLGGPVSVCQRVSLHYHILQFAHPY